MHYARHFSISLNLENSSQGTNLVIIENKHKKWGIRVRSKRYGISFIYFISIFIRYYKNYMTETDDSQIYISYFKNYMIETVDC